MEWIRGDRIGHGSFGSVHLAIPTNQNSQFHQVMAVKSASVFNSEFLENERDVLNRLSSHRNVIKCLGYDQRFENGENLCNLLLEYASGGSLADKVKNSGNGLPGFEVRRYLKSIVEGVKYIHKNGFVHCDVKIQNILLNCENGKNVVKIADFGLAKEAKVCGGQTEFRGTPLNMSPESVNGGEYEAPADIWAIGCAVVEMLTGEPAWKCEPGSYMGSLFLRIGVGEELPEIPEKLPENGKDFLRKCFVKDPRKRWTAEMLLNHPFIVLDDDDENLVGENNDDSDALKIEYEKPSISPRCPFDFPDSPESETDLAAELCLRFVSCHCLPAYRIRQVETMERSDWSDWDCWIIVR